MAASAQSSRVWRSWERVLLVLFLMVRSIFFFRRIGVPLGYDLEDHLMQFAALKWTAPMLPADASYYGYHPPLGFLFGHTFNLLGFTPLVSAQIVSFIAVLIAFFCLRATLKHLRLLDRPEGVAMLYFAAGMPMAVYLSMAVNLDVIILAWAAAILYVSCLIFWLPRKTARPPLLECALLSALLIAAMLTKFSGILLLATPFLVVLAAPRLHWWKAVRAILICAIAVACVLPYYTARYYVPKGTFFYNTVGDIARRDEVRVLRAERDKHPVRYAMTLVLPLDNRTPFLRPTWRSFWYAEDREAQSQTAISIIHLYYRLMPALILLGLVVFFRRIRQGQAWERFGAVLLASAGPQLAGLLYFIWMIPIEGYFNNKGTYIAPVLLLIAFPVASSPRALQWLPMRFRPAENTVWLGMMVLVAEFMLLNHLLPVY